MQFLNRKTPHTECTEQGFLFSNNFCYQKKLDKFIFYFRYSGGDWYYVREHMIPLIFFPKLRFQNIKSVERPLDYGPNSKKYYWLGGPHQFEYKETLKVVSYCQFEFSNFPFDSQQCNFTLGT